MKHKHHTKKKVLAKRKSKSQGKRTNSDKHATKIVTVQSETKTVSLAGIKAHIKIAREGLEEKLKIKMLERYKAKTKLQRKRIGKEITALKRDIKKLS